MNGTPDTPPDSPLSSEHPLTLADCIRIALERNPRTRSTWEAARSAAARVGEERADYLPSVDLRAQTSRGKTVSLDKEEENRTRDVYAAGIDVGYLLFDGGARTARVEGAEAAFSEAGSRHNTKLQDIALAVEASYYELLGAQWLLKVAEGTVRRTRYQLELARARHESGVVTRADVLRAETQRADAQLQHVRARNGVRISYGRLAHAMGIPVHSTFEIAELPGDVQQDELPRIELLLDEAARQRPELQAALARIETIRAQVAEGKAAYWPTLSAEASAGRRDTDFVPEREEWAVGLTVAFPLFDGFERRSRVERARADLGKAMADHADLLQGIELDVWTAYWRLAEAAEAVVAATTLAASARESARLAEGEYKSGVTSIVGLIDAQTAQTEAERRLIQARLDWYTAKARFEWAVGRSLAANTRSRE
ncbi:MAG: TolC family protein [Victivallales bacterium]|nr:TolC family protein [Victivallales bacterium]